MAAKVWAHGYVTDFKSLSPWLYFDFKGLSPSWLHIIPTLEIRFVHHAYAEVLKARGGTKTYPSGVSQPIPQERGMM